MFMELAVSAYRIGLKKKNTEFETNFYILIICVSFVLWYYGKMLIKMSIIKIGNTVFYTLNTTIF